MPKPLELLWGALFKAPPTFPFTGSRYDFAGLTVIPSGSVAKTVSNQNVGSGMFVLFGTQPGSVGVGANSGGHVVVNSVVDGISMSLSRANGVAAPWDETVMWVIAKSR